MDPHAIYKGQRLVGWTRIDMLVALYDAAIVHAERALAALRDEQEVTATRELLRATRIIVVLQSGLNPAYGKLPEHIDQLCAFVNSCLLDRSPTKIEAAIRVLTTLREAFEEIRPEVVELEGQGAIPPLQQIQTVRTIA